VLYGCRLGAQDYFTYSQADCGGFAIIQTEGWLYTVPPTANALPMYRCYDAAHYDHFLAANATCEGVANATAEGLLGYATTY